MPWFRSGSRNVHRLLGAAAAVLSVAFTAPGDAATQDVSGAWGVTWAQAVRNNPDGSMEIQRWGDAELVLGQDGDQVSGRWTTQVSGRVTWTVRGTLAGDRLTLTASEHDSDDPQLAQVLEMRWRGRLAGDRLEGEMTLVFRGADRPRPWRPWRAVRAEPGGGARRPGSG